MNPLTNVKNIQKLSEQELRTNYKTSWHDQYKNSAWLFIGGLPYDLTEGDVICVFSQYGEVVNINLIRDKTTGTSRGFCFLCYEDQRSTILAVDNFNGTKILGRTIRVDHVSDYKVPKEGKVKNAAQTKLYDEGCATVPVKLKSELNDKEKPANEKVKDTGKDKNAIKDKDASNDNKTEKDKKIKRKSDKQKMKKSKIKCKKKVETGSKKRKYSTSASSSNSSSSSSTNTSSSSSSSSTGSSSSSSSRSSVSTTDSSDSD